jgi:hypothetical protein
MRLGKSMAMKREVETDLKKHDGKNRSTPRTSLQRANVLPNT